MQTTLIKPRLEKRQINGKPVEVREGVFWIQKQRQLHSMHYITPYQACFAPQIPEYFIHKFSNKGDKILDPFCGRGTTILEANLNSRTGIGFDVSPLAIQIAKTKLKNILYEEVEKRLKEIDFSKKVLDGYDDFKYIYHPDTYSQIINLKGQLGNSRIDNFIKTIILGRLHGHSPAFFSVFTFNVISPSPLAIKRQSEKHGTKPEFRDVVPRILLKSKTVLRDRIVENKNSYVKSADSRSLPLPSRNGSGIKLIVTSPPFLNTINYIDDNWLRLWFLGIGREKLRKTLVQTDSLEEYREFLKGSMKEMHRVLHDNGVCAIEVGDVSHKSKKLNLDELVVELSGEVGFEVKELLINHISAPKISKAFSESAKMKGTRTNRCTIMEKV